MLCNDDTIKLIRKAKSGDNNAKEELLLNNVGLVRSIAKRFVKVGIEFDDVYQLGCMGFLKAIKNFDESFDVKFSTYAVPMIVGEIKRFLRDDGAIKVSRIIKIQALKINRFIEEYKNDKGEEPRIEEIAKAFDMSREEVAFALDSSRAPISLNGVLDDGDDELPSLIEKIPDKFSEDEMLDKIMFSSLIEKLPEREKSLIIMRYYRDKTQSETAKILGISQVQVSRIENKILKEFKNVI